jgi:NADH-quinone oxidoreductase subunit K
VIHLFGPVVLSSCLAGLGIYGLVARRNAVMVLIGAELLLNAVNVLLVTVAAMPPGGLVGLASGASAAAPSTADPLLAGQSLAVFLVTIAAAEIGLALAVVLLLFRTRATTDLTAVRDLGEVAPPPVPPEGVSAASEDVALSEPVVVEVVS